MISRVATLYPKCPLFNKKLSVMQRNKNVWPIHTHTKKNLTEMCPEEAKTLDLL